MNDIEVYVDLFGKTFFVGLARICSATHRWGGRARHLSNRNGARVGGIDWRACYA